MALSREEQETVIRFDQETKEASLYTSSPAIYRRMVKRSFKGEPLDSCSWEFIIPRQCVKLPSKPRVLSEKQKASMRDRMKELKHGKM